MNSGAVTKRYARALLLYTQERGSGARVCARARAMLRNADDVPSSLEPDLERFIALMVQKGRADYIRRVLRCFVDLYAASEGLMNVQLITAAPFEGLEDRVRAAVERRTGCKVIIETEVDPGLIGGFRIIAGGEMLDASVRHQLDLLRRQYVQKINRIV